MSAGDVLAEVPRSSEVSERPTDCRLIDTDSPCYASLRELVLLVQLDDLLALARGEVCVMTNEVRHRLTSQARREAWAQWVWEEGVVLC